MTSPPRRRGGLVLIALTLTLAISGRAQGPAGDVTVPLGVFRPPAVLVVDGAGTSAAVADALAAHGIAVLRHTLVPNPAPNPGPSDDPLVRGTIERLTALRNDARFPTVSVLGRGAAAAVAAIAARIGRADGFIAMAPQSASADVARLIVPVFDAPDGEGAAAAMAAFARRVAPLGRRGTREPRPATPRLSPRAVALATIDGTRIGIEYGQPQARGRAIWGGLVVWDRVWMPGADEATTISTTTAVTIGELAVPAGDHTFYLWPREDRVALVVSRDVGQFHTVYAPSQEIGRADMTLARRPDRVEGLTFVLDARETGGVLKMIWDDREYAVPIAVRTPAEAPPGIRPGGPIGGTSPVRAGGRSAASRGLDPRNRAGIEEPGWQAP